MHVTGEYLYNIVIIDIRVDDTYINRIQYEMLISE